MDQIPPEILTHIFSYLSHPDLLTVNKVCRYWRSISFSSDFWMNLNIADCKDGELELYVNSLCNIAGFVQTLQIQCEQLQSIFKKVRPDADFLNLRKLHLADDLLADEVKFCAQIVKMFPKLTSIKIAFYMTPDFPTCLSNLSILQLKELNIWLPFGSDSAFLDFISRQPDLTSLTIWDGELKRETLRQILKHLDNLTCLDFGYMDSLDGCAFDDFQAFPKLTTISLSDTGLDDEGLELITTRALNSKTIYLFDNENLTDVGIGYIANNCTNLECLTISECRNVYFSSQTLEMLGKGCSKIKRICLKGPTYLDLNDSGLIPLVNSCEQLQRIDIESDNISTAALIAISDVCVRLSHLTIDGRNFYVNGIERVLTQNRQLKYISIGDCLDVNKIDLHKFTKGFANEKSRSFRHSCINSINITGRPFSSHGVIEEIAAFCPDLRSLSLPSVEVGCANAHIVMLETVFQQCIFLEELNLGRDKIRRPGIRQETNK